MHRNKQKFYYILFDIIAALATWIGFDAFRKEIIQANIYRNYGLDWKFGYKFYIALIVFPIFWIILHFLCGYYKDAFRKSRFEELSQTFVATFIGVTFLFFFILLDDYVSHYTDFYFMYLVLFLLQFFLTLIPRIITTNITNRKIKKRKLLFNSLIIGDNQKALEVLEEINTQKFQIGLNFIGFVNIEKKEKYLIGEYLPSLGCVDDILDIINKNNIEEIVIAIETNEHSKIKDVLYKLQGTNIPIKIIPEMYDILTGKVKMTAIYGIPLIDINHNVMPIWQQYVKIISDFVLSLIAIIVLFPLYLIVGFAVKITSSGPVFFKQERIGKNCKPFKIIKFRTMYEDAEKIGPQLSSKDDPRITKIGKFLRKTRLDEIPQFFNVLKGDMSLVGPRPERQFYIDQIVKKAPYYMNILSIKPGITGWGQIKNGYAINVDEMISRLRFDILYLENRSIFLDVKILLFTVLVVFQKKGV